MKEKCNWCSTTWDDFRSLNATTPEKDLASAVMQALRQAYKSADCKGKICMPYLAAKKRFEECDRQGNTPLIGQQEPVPENEGFFMRRARQVVEDKILDEVKGHPDKFTAFESARKCGCNQCVSLYNSWIDVWGQGDPKYDKFKRHLKGARHIED